MATEPTPWIPPPEVAQYAEKGPQDVGGTLNYSVGPQLFDPALFANGGGHSAASGITAYAGGGQANATPISAGINRIGTCRTAGDSIGLPRATGGQLLVVLNGTNNACQVFAAPGSTDTINGLAGSAGVNLATAKVAMFCSAGPGAWFWLLGS
jgi:hypothetical protein